MFFIRLRYWFLTNYHLLQVTANPKLWIWKRNLSMARESWLIIEAQLGKERGFYRCKNCNVLSLLEAFNDVNKEKSIIFNSNRHTRKKCFTSRIVQFWRSGQLISLWFLLRLVVCGFQVMYFKWIINCWEREGGLILIAQLCHWSYVVLASIS